MKRLRIVYTLNPDIGEREAVEQLRKTGEELSLDPERIRRMMKEQRKGAFAGQ